MSLVSFFIMADMTDALNNITKIWRNKTDEKQIIMSALAWMLTIVSLSYLYSLYKEWRRQEDLKLVSSVLRAIESNRNNRQLKYDAYMTCSLSDSEFGNVYNFLHTNGFKVGSEEYDFNYGCSIPVTIAKTVSCSNKIIAILSPAYLKSGCKELDMMYTLEQIFCGEASTNCVVLIRNKKCDIPLDMRGFQCINYCHYCGGVDFLDAFTEPQDCAAGRRNHMMTLNAFLLHLLGEDDNHSGLTLHELSNEIIFIQQ